jgi:hypothetical protein
VAGERIIRGKTLGDPVISLGHRHAQCVETVARTPDLMAANLELDIWVTEEPTAGPRFSVEEVIWLSAFLTPVGTPDHRKPLRKNLNIGR